jgi:hypothetical protein
MRSFRNRSAQPLKAKADPFGFSPSLSLRGDYLSSDEPDSTAVRDTFDGLVQPDPARV